MLSSNHNVYLHFADKLVGDIMDDINGKKQIVQFSSSLAFEIIAEGIEQFQVMESYSENLVKGSLEEATQLLDRQLPTYTDNLITNIISEALDEDSLNENLRRYQTVEAYADKLSTDLLSSVLPPQGHQNNPQLDCFCGNLISDVCDEAIKEATTIPKQHDSMEAFSNNIIENCFQNAFYNDLKLTNWLPVSNQQEANDEANDEDGTSTPANSEDVYYRVKYNNDRRLSESSLYSNYSYRGSRKNSGMITFSDAVTPSSTCNDSFMRGLYNFADQLLHSLSTLETDGGGDQALFLADGGPGGSMRTDRRNTRSDSCPVIPDHRHYIETVCVNRRKMSIDASLQPPSIPNYANVLATSILNEVNINP